MQLCIAITLSFTDSEFVTEQRTSGLTQRSIILLASILVIESLPLPHITSPLCTMSAIRQSVKVFNRRGIFHVTRTRAFCSGGMKTDEVQEKDLFITKVHSDDIQVFRASNAKFFDRIH